MKNIKGHDFNSKYKQSINSIFMKKMKLFAIVLGIFALTTPAFAAETLVFSNEYQEENANDLILDFDDTGGDVTLQFGNTLGEQLFWDDTNSQFVFTDDLSVQGNISVTGTVDGVDISTLDTTVTNHLNGAANKHDASEIDVETAGNITTVSDLETNLGAFDTAIGNRTYTEDNYVVDGESLTSSLDSLDQQIKDNADAITGTSGSTGTTSNIYTLDTDDTGGNVTLQFGTTLAEQLYWDNAAGQFVLSDDLSIQGDLATSGTVNGTTLSTTALDFQGNATIATNDDTLAINTSDWDISTTGEITGVSIDADGVGNSITNIENANIKVGANIDFAKMATRTKTMFVNMNDLTFEEDGGSNQVNVYNDSESGSNPHQFYLIKSRRSALNDLDLKMKIKLPEDFVDFTTNTTDLSFDYKNTGTDNTDSKIDILVEDDDGDDAFTAANGQGLFSTAWTSYTDEFDGASFDPSGGEYIYVTIKGYASKDGATEQSAYIGELVITYTGR